MINGIDVSHHNATLPKLDEVSFGLVRSSFGKAGTDHLALAHLMALQAAGVPVLGVYHYQRGDSSGLDQAAWFTECVLELESELKTRLVLALDLEDLLAPAPPWPRAEYRQIAIDFLAAIRGTFPHRRCMVYGGTWFLNEVGLPTDIGVLHPLWFADPPPPSAIPKPWKSWFIHQTGVYGGIDRNVFAGTIRELQDALLLPVTDPALSAVLEATRKAEGRGEGPETFESNDEGPGS